jgi:type IV pilus assembly protein PilY1
VIHKSTGIVLGLAVAFLGGAPALADDTELLLVTPPDPSQLKPNVMFILDTSGSMNTVQVFGAAYDSLTDYSAFGSCDPNNMYYTEDGSTPVCDASNTRYIAKASWNCAAAQTQIEGVGTYTGVMVQYRSSFVDVDGDGIDEGTDVRQWQPLEPGNSSDDVECEADSGVHGSGAVLLSTTDPVSTSDPYVTNAADPDGDGWTSEPLQEVAWGSSGVNMTYSIYDGNYLNYQSDPATRDISRSEVMKEVTKKVLNSVNDMNVGLMRFNNSEGGVVIQAPIDLDTNREAILAEVDGVNADGWTPLSETLFENALFWQGLPAYYGELYEQHATDPRALASNPPEVYLRPDMLYCSKNFNVLITDGAPTNDVDTPGLLGQLPNYTTVTGRAGCTGTGDGACLDDVGEYLANTDINPTLNGRQSVITHTIGFTIDLPLLQETARLSGGQYFQANDTDSLLAALSAVVSQINERALSYSAPAVSVNTFNRTRNLNDLYITMFGARGAAHWPGNLKAYRIEDGVIVDALGNEAVDPGTGFFYDTARSFWTDGQADGNDVLRGGAANELPDPGTRRLFTDNGSDNNLSGGTNAISTGNTAAFTQADFGLPVGSPVTVDEMIRWMRGEDTRDIDGDPLTTVRQSMGDPLHSRPVAMVYGGTADNPVAVIYMATNDGYLHAIDAQTGAELWSYVPRDLLPRMAILYDDPEMKYKLYGIDGDIVPIMRDVDRDGQIEPLDGDRAFILFGLRRGGSKFRMLDVTDRNKPVLIWERVVNAGGESWSAPVVTRMQIAGETQNAFQAVVVVGGGYDRVHDTATYNPAEDLVGAGVHVLDLISGETLWHAGGANNVTADLRLDKMTKSIPTRIKVVDINGDSFADRMYAADLGGQIWRFDITNGNNAAGLVAGGVIARLGAEGLVRPKAADTRRFYNSPDIAVFQDTRQNRRYVAINIGSGYRAHPLDLSAADRFYSIRDPYVFNQLSQNQYDNFTPFTEADLVEVSGQVNTTISATDAGWMLTLPDNQMVLAESVTFNDEIFFVSFSPDTSGAAACNVGMGTNFLYRVGIINGDPIMDDYGNIPAGGEDDARRTQLAQGGIAPTPQFLFPTPDPTCTGADCNPPPLGCIGVECFDPGFVNNPVRTLWTQDGIE